MRIEPTDRIVIDNRKRVLLMIFYIYNGVLTGGADNKGESDIVVPDKVKSIGFDAFGGRRGVRKIVLPNSVTRIENRAFINCTDLAEIVLPESLTHIGVSAFEGCTSLTEITLPKGITRVCDSLFSGCKKLSRVSLPEGVTRIGNNAFLRCESLTRIDIPESVEIIDRMAFLDCKRLSEINVPAGIKQIGSAAFNRTEWLMEQTGDFCILGQGILYKYNGSNPDVVIPSCVKQIGNHAFYQNAQLTSLVIPDSVSCIGESAFLGCKSLTRVSIPESVQDIGKYAFSECESLIEINIPEKIPSIEDDIFSGCKKLYDVSIPKNVVRIGRRAFAGCAINNLVLPEGLKEIGDAAFSDCRMDSVVVPKTVMKTGVGVFCGCPQVTIYDTIDPDAKPCTNSARKGAVNSLVGLIGAEYVSNDLHSSYSYNWKNYEIIVRSAQTDEIINRVWMCADPCDFDYQKVLASSWGRNATFNGAAVDCAFQRTGRFEQKFRVAAYRLRYPVRLSKTHKEKYIEFLAKYFMDYLRTSKTGADFEMFRECANYCGIITPKNIDEMINVATEQNAVAFSAFLLEYKRTHFGRSTVWSKYEL